MVREPSPAADITVRPAGPDDVTALAGLATRLDPDAFADPSAAERATYLSPTRSPAGFRRGLREHTVLVAVLDSRLVGFAQFGPIAGSGPSAGGGDRRLLRLHVARTLQGRGIGRALMREALARPELADASRVSLRVARDNAPAIALYRRLGFRFAEPGPSAAGTVPGGDPMMVLDRGAGRRCDLGGGHSRPSH